MQAFVDYDGQAGMPLIRLEEDEQRSMCQTIAILQALKSHCDRHNAEETQYAINRAVEVLQTLTRNRDITLS